LLPRWSLSLLCWHIQAADGATDFGTGSSSGFTGLLETVMREFSVTRPKESVKRTGMSRSRLLCLSDALGGSSPSLTYIWR
jgi:hypothetical protein